MADNGGPTRPRGRIGAFRGGPFGIGWAPWAIGAGALALGIFVFMRGRGGAANYGGTAQGAPGGLPVTSQPSVNVFPYPTGGGSPAPGPTPNPSTQQLYQVHPQPWSFAPGQTGEPIFSAPSWKSSPRSFVPLGSQFAPTGPPVAGLQALTDLGQSSYYLPYQGGYISAAAATLIPNPSAQQLTSFAA